MRNFGISVFGGIDQKIIVNAASPTEFGLPPASEPDLTRFSLEDAFDDGEPDLFRLLRWDYGLVETLYGRDEDLSAILDWADRGGNAATVRLVTGEGGAGKTRLAAEAASKLRDQGWTAGFLPRHDSVLFEVAEGGLFLILDYPEEQMERARALFAKLAELKSTPYPIRLLLLSRRPFVEWEHEGAILDGRFGRHAVAAPGALSLDDGEALIVEAAQHFAKKIGRAEPDLTPARSWLEQSPLHALPLFAMAAAVHAVLAPQDAFGLGGSQLMRDLAKREHRRVRAASRALGLGDEGLTRLLALGVLADGLSQKAVKTLTEAGAVDGDARDVVGALAGTPWWCNGRLVRLQPDRPAAAFMDLVLFPPSFASGRDELPDWLFMALEERADTFGERLGRIFYDLASLDRTNPGAHPLDAALINMLERDPARTETFAPVAHQESFHWAASFAISVATALVNRVENPVLRAPLLNNLANFHSNLAHHEEALSCAEQAVGLYRELACATPNTFAHGLATSLANLANRLLVFHRYEEAQQRAKEAVAVHRKLVRLSSTYCISYLAQSLNIQAICLWELGRYPQALRLGEEANRLYRELEGSKKRVGILSELASSYNTLANITSSMSRDRDSLAKAMEATKIFRMLASDYPENFNPRLAICLTNLAIRLAKLCQWEEAVERAEEAVAICSVLMEARPEAFAGDHALCLNNLAGIALDFGNPEAALQPVGQATDIYRKLFEARRGAHSLDLAKSLHNWAYALWQLRRCEETRERAEEAARILAPIIAARPATFAPWMGKVAQMYLQASEATGLKPDLALLEPFAERFQGMGAA